MPVFGIVCPSYANMFQRDNAVVTTINTVNIFEDVVNFTTGEKKTITFASSTLTTGNASETYLIQYDACIDDTTNKTYEMAIKVGGIIQNESLSCTTIPTGGNPDGLGGNLIKTIAANKDIKLVIRNITDTSNVVVVHASVSLLKI